jgi:dynein heavy chain
LKRPTEPHAVSPCFENGDYTWKPVQVLSYDEKERKFKVRQVHNNKEKTVTRLSLLFYAEDPERFKERVELCKLRQKHVEQELRFTDLVDSIPADAVSTLSKERREMFSSRAWNFIYNKFNQQATGFDPEKVSDQLKKLNQVVMEEYIRQMKKCIVIKEMQDPTNFAKFAKLKVPIRINKKTNPYFGVVRCPKYEFSAVQHEIE